MLKRSGIRANKHTCFVLVTLLQAQLIELNLAVDRGVGTTKIEGLLAIDVQLQQSKTSVRQDQGKAKEHGRRKLASKRGDHMAENMVHETCEGCAYPEIIIAEELEHFAAHVLESEVLRNGKHDEHNTGVSDMQSEREKISSLSLDAERASKEIHCCANPRSLSHREK